MQIDFGPGSENFLFARNRNIDLYKAGQETAKDHTMTTSKVQRLNSGRERSFSSNGICSASSLLWMTDNAVRMITLCTSPLCTGISFAAI